MIESQFIEYVVKQLVDHPDAVKVERTEDERGVLLNLSVDPEDLGRVIGKHGATAQSLRALLRALGTKNNDHYNLKIIDTDGEKDDAPESEDLAGGARADGKYSRCRRQFGLPIIDSHESWRASEYRTVATSYCCELF